MNIELLRKIQTQIREHPETFRMDEWNCGTAMCIAGHAISLSGLEWWRNAHDHFIPIRNGRKEAPHLLGQQMLALDSEEANRLFYESRWPGAFQRDDNETYSYAERVSIACERIDHFIATNGAE